jgi:signal peptidase I
MRDATDTRARRLARMVAGGLGRALLLLAVAMLAATFVPALLGYHRYVLVGGSMEPTIHRGSLVFDEVVPVSALRRGDVITYIPPITHEPVSHRIISVERGPDGQRIFRTKGDHNAAPDLRRFTLREPRQARVKFAIPYAGWPLMWLATRWARIVLLALPAVLLAGWVVLGVWRQGGELLAAEQAGAPPEGS